MKTLQLMAVIVAAALLSSSCHSSKKTAYTRSLYKELKRELPDATVLSQGDTVRVIYPELVMFDFGKDDIKAGALPSFVRFAYVLNKYDKVDFIINGYTDNVGPDHVNASLSENRAKRAYDLMVKNNVKEGRMRTNGHGSANPLRPNTTSEGRGSNRRVEFLLYETTR